MRVRMKNQVLLALNFDDDSDGEGNGDIDQNTMTHSEAKDIRNTEVAQSPGGGVSPDDILAALNGSAMP